MVGDVPLTPIQHWFFEKELPAFDHFNQAELLATDALDPDVLRLALTDLIEHHDALRLRCVDGDDGWRQYLDESVDTDVLDVHDLSDVAADALSAVSFGIAEETQNGLDLAKGPLIRCALLELGATRGQRLLIAVHHLAVDGVSWRILLEDLGSCYEQRAAGEDAAAAREDDVLPGLGGTAALVRGVGRGPRRVRVLGGGETRRAGSS